AEWSNAFPRVAGRWIAAMTRASRSRAFTTMVLAPSVLAWAPGCSYALVHGPPAPVEVASTADEPPPQATTSCTTSNAAPIVDTILAVPLLGAGVLTIVAGAAQGSCGGQFCVKVSSGAAVVVGAA